LQHEKSYENAILFPENFNYQPGTMIRLLELKSSTCSLGNERELRVPASILFFPR